MSLTYVEARARAATLSVQAYDVTLDLRDPDHFRSTSTIRFTAVASGDTDPASWRFVEIAHARSLTASLDGSPLATDGYDGDRLALPALDGEHELVVDAEIDYVTTGDGMHEFTDPADGERYVSAYCGMNLAHAVFACFDQPDLKAPITLHVTADPAWTVLANGVAVGNSGLEGRWDFSPTPAISTYLFVVCAGPWASVVWEHAGLPFGWHARSSLRPQLERDADELRTITERCYDHYTATFDEPYPFASCHAVLVPELNWGAMEQPGCVIYRDEMVPRDPPPPAERLWRATVIAHELSHMWFGDLATMRWWQDSWLNESFADYMGYQVAGAAAGFAGAWVGWALERRPTAYDADARRSTHPIAEDAERTIDVDTAFGNFDMITYAKGGATLRQLVTWLGEEDFLTGVNRYLTRHAFGNADLADFLAALDGVSDRDVAAWAQAWLRTTGFDTLRVDRDGGIPVLHREGERPHRLHVGAYDDRGRLVDERVVDVGAEPVPLAWADGLALLPDSRQETYARRSLDTESWAWAHDHLSDVTDPLSRTALWSVALDRTRAGELPLAGLVDLAERHLPEETEALVVDNLLQLLHARVVTWSDPTELADLEARLSRLASDLAVPGSEVELAALRIAIATSRDAEALASRLTARQAPSGHPLSADLRWDVVARLAALGAADATLVVAERERDPSSQGHLGALRAEATRPDADAKAEAWARMCAPEVSNREFGALADGLWCPATAALVVDIASDYIAIAPALAARGQAFSQTVGRRLPVLPLPLDTLEAFRARLADALATGVPTVLRRSWNDRLDDLDVALAVRTRSQPSSR